MPGCWERGRRPVVDNASRERVDHRPKREGGSSDLDRVKWRGKRPTDKWGSRKAGCRGRREKGILTGRQVR